jgi:proline dehydrogenase
LIFQGEVAATKNLHLLVDAEYSYVKPGCSLIALAMMAVFNQNRPVVANTYQCYFKVTTIFFMTYHCTVLIFLLT